MFWQDLLTDSILAHQFPRLFSFARDHEILVNKTMTANNLNELFFLPLSQAAFDELVALQILLQSVAYDENSNDTGIFLWGGQIYTSGKFYKLAFKHLQTPPSFSWVWKSKCTPMLQRRHFQVHPNTHCVMCQNQVEEDFYHLSFQCPFTTACWSKINVTWGHIADINDSLRHLRQIALQPYAIEIFLIARHGKFGISEMGKSLTTFQ
jgi:hypothetical protein